MRAWSCQACIVLSTHPAFPRRLPACATLLSCSQPRGRALGGGASCGSQVTARHARAGRRVPWPPLACMLTSGLPVVHALGANTTHDSPPPCRPCPQPFGLPTALLCCRPQLPADGRDLPGKHLYLPAAAAEHSRTHLWRVPHAPRVRAGPLHCVPLCRQQAVRWWVGRGGAHSTALCARPVPPRLPLPPLPAAARRCVVVGQSAASSRQTWVLRSHAHK